MSLGWSPVYLALWAATAAAPEESFLGLHTAPPRLFGDEDPFDAEDDQSGEGLQVTFVVENSPAQQAGFQVGDVLLKVNRQIPRSPRHLDSLVAALPVGTELRMYAQRGAEILGLSARTVPRLVPRPAPAVEGYVERRRLGIVVEDVVSLRPVAGQDTPQRRLVPGVRIRRFLNGSPGPDAGLSSGDLVLAINGETVHGGADFLALAAKLEPGSMAELLTNHVDEQRRARVKIRDPGRHVSKFLFPLLVDYEREVARDKVRFGLLPFNLFKYERVENRQTYCFLWFICLSTGSNEVLEDVE